jgi:iron complex transport system ATP-binding protein
MTPLLQCDDVCISAGGKALASKLQWRIAAGECWGLLGPNGCGKTTLLLSLAGLSPLDHGEILFKQRNINSYSRRQLARLVGLLFQHNSYDFPTTVAELVMTGRFAHQPLLAGVTDAERCLVSERLQELGIAQLAGRQANTLSGGEMQRVAMAILLTQAPSLALLDEPENHLDPGVTIKLLQSVKDFFSKNNKGLVVALHDPSLALRLCSHLLLLFGDGRYLAGATATVATAENLSALYAHPMGVVDTDDGQLFYPR